MKLSDINNLDAKNYGSWPMPIKFVSTLLLFFVVLVAGYFMKIRPANDELDVLRAKEQELIVAFTEKQGKVVNLEEYKKQLEEMRELLRQMIRQLPSKTEMPRATPAPPKPARACSMRNSRGAASANACACCLRPAPTVCPTPRRSRRD